MVIFDANFLLLLLDPKIDRQIVACGIVERATSIFADDQSVTRLARSAGMGVVSSWELPLPPEDPQISMDV